MTEQAQEKEISSLEDLEVANIEGTKYSFVSIESANGKRFRLHLGSVSAGDIIDWQEQNETASKTAGLRLICKALVSATEPRVRYAAKFDAKTVEVLRALPHVEYEKLLRAVMKLNEFRTPEDEKAKEATPAKKG